MLNITWAIDNIWKIAATTIGALGLLHTTAVKFKKLQDNQLALKNDLEECQAETAKNKEDLANYKKENSDKMYKALSNLDIKLNQIQQDHNKTRETLRVSDMENKTHRMYVGKSVENMEKIVVALQNNINSKNIE